MGHPIDSYLLAGVRLTAKTLSTQELSSLYLAVTMNADPKHVIGYEKARSLFTEADGTRMHSATKEAFEVVVMERMSKEEK